MNCMGCAHAIDEKADYWRCPECRLHYHGSPGPYPADCGHCTNHPHRQLELVRRVQVRPIAFRVRERPETPPVVENVLFLLLKLILLRIVRHPKVALASGAMLLVAWIASSIIQNAGDSISPANQNRPTGVVQTGPPPSPPPNANPPAQPPPHVEERLIEIRSDPTGGPNPSPQESEVARKVREAVAALDGSSPVTIEAHGVPGNCRILLDGAVVNNREDVTVKVGPHTFQFIWPDGTTKTITRNVTNSESIEMGPLWDSPNIRGR